MRRETYVAEDGKHISLCVWDEVESPKGIVQIVHGMAEHVARYDEFARYLNARGFIVAGDDHRAHGQTDPNDLGFVVGEGDLFEKTVGDERGITDWLLERYRLPLVLFGHSYGSFLTQRYLTISADKLAGTVLCGSAFMQGATVNLGAYLANRKCKKKKGAGKDDPGLLFARMTFGAYDKKLKDGINGWLNRDESEVRKFNEDLQCGFICSNGFYKYFFNGLKTIAADDLANLRKDLPLLIISGSCDYVGGLGKLVKKLEARYRAVGLNPQMKLYEGARHELTVETCRQEVFADVTAFAERCVAGKDGE